MIWIVIIVLAAILYILVKNGNRNETKPNPSVNKRGNAIVSIPNDAHDAVERFAAISSQTQSFLKQNGWWGNPLARASIFFTFGADDSHSKVSMWFDFDTSMEGFHERLLGYRLGDGFSVNGDKVLYESMHIQNLQQWLGITPRNVVSGNDSSLVEPIAITFMNNCPDAYVEAKAIDQTGCFVGFRFR